MIPVAPVIPTTIRIQPPSETHPGPPVRHLRCRFGLVHTTAGGSGVGRDKRGVGLWEAHVRTEDERAVWIPETHPPVPVLPSLLPLCGSMLPHPEC